MPPRSDLTCSSQAPVQASSALSGALPPSCKPRPVLRAQLSGEETIVRVFFDDPPTGRLIAASWEPIESKYENGCLVVEVTAEQLQRLQQRGLRTEPVSAQELSTILAPRPA